MSSEAFGEFNKKSDFKARVIPKSEEIRQKIVNRLNMTFMF